MNSAGGHNVVVTGGLGFIGSHVVDALLGAGHRVVIIDSMVAAVTDGAEYERHPRCEVWRESICGLLRPRPGLRGDRSRDPRGVARRPGGDPLAHGTSRHEIVASSQLVVDGVRRGRRLAVRVQLGRGLRPQRPAQRGRRRDRAGALQRAARVRDRQAARPRRWPINCRHRGLVADRDPALQRHGLAAVARRRVRAADLRPAGAGRRSADRVRRRDPDPRLPGGERPHAASWSSTSTTRSRAGHPSSTSATPATPRASGRSRSGWCGCSAARRRSSTHDAQAIHGPLYEEAESLEKLPVEGAAAAIGWLPRMGSTH